MLIPKHPLGCRSSLAEENGYTFLLESGRRFLIYQDYSTARQVIKGPAVSGTPSRMDESKSWDEQYPGCRRQYIADAERIYQASVFVRIMYKYQPLKSYTSLQTRAFILQPCNFYRPNFFFSNGLKIA